jgi:hypothetical protein
MGLCGKAAAAKVGLLVAAAILIWLMYGDHRTTPEEKELVERLEEERRLCLWRKGLDSSRVLGNDQTFSTFNCPLGTAGQDAYPRDLCTAHMLYLDHTEKRFVARLPADVASRVNIEFSSFHWPVRVTADPLPLCTHYFDEAFVFSVDMSTSPDDRYYRLHTSTFLPLYSLMMLRRHLGPITSPGYHVTLMPAVEDFSVKAVDWNSDAFTGHHKYELGQQILEAFAGGMETVPLVVGSLKTGDTTCMRVAHFGVGVVNISDPSLLRGFSVFIRARLGLPLPMPSPLEPVVCLVRRSGNRRILNEEEVVSALSKFVRVEVVQLDALSYREQVAQMQQFTILVGFHGAELLNALYMPADSVTIQLVPFGSKSLPVSEYAQLLRANGPYLEWQNKNERMNRPSEVGDRDSNRANTVLDIDDIGDLVESAMKMGLNAKLVRFSNEDGV